MLDFTSDLKTALFFACCKYENGKWEPLKRNDFESKRSRPKVSRIGGDSRYGVIYSCLSEIADLERRMQVNDAKAE